MRYSRLAKAVLCAIVVTFLSSSLLAPLPASSDAPPIIRGVDGRIAPQATPEPLDEYQYLPLVAKRYWFNTAIPETTKVLSETTTEHLTSVSGDGSVYTFSESTPELEALAPGDVMVADATDVAPNGFLREVTQVSTAGNQVIIETQRATLEGAIEKGTISTSQSLTPDDIQESTGVAGVTLFTGPQSPDAEVFRYSLDHVVIFDLDGNHATKNDQVTADGEVVLDLEYDFNLTIRHFRVQELGFSVTSVETADLEIESHLQRSLSAEKEIARHYFTPITILVGPVPVVFTPVLVVNVGVDGSIHVDASAAVDQQASMTAGVEYDGSWRPVYDFTNTFDFTPPTVSASLNFRGYAGANLAVLLYGVAGAYTDASAYLELEADIHATPWWELYGGLEVLGGAKIDVLGHSLADYQATLIDYRVLLAQAQTYTTWAEQTSGTSSRLVDVDFVDANTGWAIGGDNEVLRTTNGGSVWTHGTVETDHIGAVCFITDQDGWVAGRSANATRVLRTSDGGKEWTLQYERDEELPCSVSDIEFADNSNGWLAASDGWIVGSSGFDILWATDDGGDSWDSVLRSQIDSVILLPSGRGWTVGWGYIVTTPPFPSWTKIHKTSDSGQTWVEQSSPVSTGLLGVDFIDDSHGWAVGPGGVIIHTANGGTTWRTQDSGTTCNLRDVVFVDRLEGWAVGDEGTILHTADSGRSWQAEVSGTTLDLSAIEAGDATNFWAVGVGGTILHGQRQNIMIP